MPLAKSALQFVSSVHRSGLKIEEGALEITGTTKSESDKARQRTMPSLWGRRAVVFLRRGFASQLMPRRKS